MPKETGDSDFEKAVRAINQTDAYQTSTIKRFEFKSDPLLARLRMTDADAQRLDHIIGAGKDRLNHKQFELGSTREDRVHARYMKHFDEAAASGATYDMWTLVNRAGDEIAREDHREFAAIKRETRCLVEDHIERSLGRVRERGRGRRR